MNHETNPKHLVAKAALEYIKSGEILGLGTGSTVDCLIQLLPQVQSKIKGIVSSSKRSSLQVEKIGIPLLNLQDIQHFDVYIDGADEINPALEMIKGGGGALTQEKIVAAHAKQFICIATKEKAVDHLGGFPLPIEVIPMAAYYVMREMQKIGGIPSIRENFITDNGNVIIDVKGLCITNPKQLETEINQITGVITNGIFAHRKADVLLITDHYLSVKTIMDTE